MRLFIQFTVVFLLIVTSWGKPNPGEKNKKQNQKAQNITLTTPDGLNLAITFTKKGVSGTLNYANNLASNGTSASPTGGSSGSSTTGSATGSKGSVSTSAATTATENGVAGSLAFAATRAKKEIVSSASYSTSIGNLTKAGSVAGDVNLKPNRNNANTKNGKKRANKSGNNNAQDTQTCGNNEVWTDTENNSCQRNCATFGLRNIACRPIPTPGCICQGGYLRNQDGICVLATECENICPGENEIYNSCPPREVTCEDIFSGETPANPNGESCVPQCVCKDGFVRREDGLCVLSENCCLDPNAIPVSCPYICPGNTCAKPEAEVCGVPCREFPKGCECKRGYTRISEEDARCVLIEECPK